LSRRAVSGPQTARFLGIAGPDDDGDYTIGKDGQPAHWTAEDAATGKSIIRDSIGVRRDS
jgi:hypothetical protein